MFESGSNGKASSKVRIDHFPVGSKLMNDLMAAVRKEFLACDLIKTKLYQVNFHTTLSGQAMVTLVYHRQLSDEWTAAATEMKLRLQTALQGSCQALSIIGRSRKQKIELDQSFVIETMTVNGQPYMYKQVWAWLYLLWWLLFGIHGTMLYVTSGRKDQAGVAAWPNVAAKQRHVMYCN